jgi:hypothetical protein
MKTQITEQQLKQYVHKAVLKSLNEAEQRGELDEAFWDKWVDKYKAGKAFDQANPNPRQQYQQQYQQTAQANREAQKFNKQRSQSYFKLQNIVSKNILPILAKIGVDIKDPQLHKKIMTAIQPFLPEYRNTQELPNARQNQQTYPEPQIPIPT